MMVDSSSGKKRKRSGSLGKGRAFSGPRMRDGRFVSGGQGAAPRSYGIRSLTEPGFVDVADTGYVLDTTGTITLLNTVPQGAGTSQRVGKKIMLKSLEFHGKAQGNGSANYNYCSILIIYDKRPTGTLPGITDVLNSASPLSFNNDANSDRFETLKRHDFELIGNATDYTAISARRLDFYLPLRGRPEVFKAAGTGAIGDISEGAIYQITIGSVAAGTGAANLDGGFRLRYVDV